MLRKRRPTPATVISLVALFVALGGTSYAALTISGKNVKNNSLTGVDIKNSSLTGSDVKNGTLRAADFLASDLPKGATGAQGPKGDTGATGAKGDTGAPGAAGATNVVVRRADLTVTSGTGIGGVSCNPGERAVGGGFSGGGATIFANQSVPSADGGINPATPGQTPNGWRVQVEQEAGGTTSTTGGVYVICAAP